MEENTTYAERMVSGMSEGHCFGDACGGEEICACDCIVCSE